MNMKVIYHLIIISLLMCAAPVHGQETPKHHIQIDFEAITLKPPFSKHEDTQRGFWELDVKFGRSLNRPHRLYDEAFISEMTAFISQHPSDTAALSTKFYLAEYLWHSWFWLESELEFDLLEVIAEDMLTLYKEIASESPDTWQGKLASHYTREYFEARLDGGEAYRAKRKAMWPLLLEIQNERDFYSLRISTGQTEPVEVSVGRERIRFAFEEGDNVAAEEEFARLKEKYPDLQQIQWIEKHMVEEYERQFHGGLTSVTPERLLHFLTSPQDSLKIRQTAAALGNREIWGTLNLHDNDKKVIDDIVLGYIDRAMTGDTPEREEMVELIYRLWHLAEPALLETLDHADPEWVAFAGERLIYMKNEEIITAIIDKARATEDEDKKAQLIEILSRMNEPCEPVMRFRECLDDAQAEELYQRLVVPALEELQTEAPTPTP